MSAHATPEDPRSVLSEFEERRSVLGRSVETPFERRLADAVRRLLAAGAPGETDELIARATIVDYLSRSPLVAAQAAFAASAFGDEVDSGYLAGAALRLGALSHESLIALVASGVHAGAARASGDAPSQRAMLQEMGVQFYESTDDEGNPSLMNVSQHIGREL